LVAITGYVYFVRSDNYMLYHSTDLKIAHLGLESVLCAHS